MWSWKLSMIRLSVHRELAGAIQAAADWLCARLVLPQTRNLMVPGGNTPLPLFAEVARRRLDLGHLRVFALDEYIGVPPEDPRTCANLLRRTVVDAWGIPAGNYRHFSTLEPEARQQAAEYERQIANAGGVDIAILGLGKNGHLGFNEPGSDSDCTGRLVDLDPISVNANREWFGGDHAPAKGVTVGIRTLLAARTVLLLAFGESKANAVRAMIEDAPSTACPASWLQGHPQTQAYIDELAAASLTRR
jgi:glucosamine-6-phosphate deaminase